MRRPLGWTMVLSAVVFLGVLIGQNAVLEHRTHQAQVRLLGEVPRLGAAHAGESHPVARAVDVGRALVVMRIPRFGHDWRWAALEGTSPTVLAEGPGHYAGTALPGQRGNAAFAAHRAGHGDPFIDFERLQPGDRVILRQGAVEWQYVLDSQPRIIPVTADWVLDPTPGRTLTLTTCWPRYGSSKRMFVRGHLVAG